MFQVRPPPSQALVGNSLHLPPLCPGVHWCSLLCPAGCLKITSSFEKSPHNKSLTSAAAKCWHTEAKEEEQQRHVSRFCAGAARTTIPRDKKGQTVGKEKETWGDEAAADLFRLDSFNILQSFHSAAVGQSHHRSVFIWLSVTSSVAPVVCHCPPWLRINDATRNKPPTRCLWHCGEILMHLRRWFSWPAD